MKILFKLLKASIFLVLMVFINPTVQAQPDPPEGHGNDGNVPGGGAPIGSGVIILMTMASAYGTKKVFDLKGYL